jgi:hypothetical protein
VYATEGGMKEVRGGYVCEVGRLCRAKTGNKVGEKKIGLYY